MTVEEYINAIKTASSSEEILNLWSRVAGESDMTMDDIINVHRSCGQIVTQAALEKQDKAGYGVDSKVILSK